MTCPAEKRMLAGRPVPSLAVRKRIWVKGRQEFSKKLRANRKLKRVGERGSKLIQKAAIRHWKEGAYKNRRSAHAMPRAGGSMNKYGSEGP